MRVKSVVRNIGSSPLPWPRKPRSVRKRPAHSPLATPGPVPIIFRVARDRDAATRKKQPAENPMTANNASPATRTEHDSMGDVEVPADAYYGAQTQRAVENFPISGTRLPATMIRAMGWVKYACAVANRDLGKLTGTGKNPLVDDQVDALLQAARDVADGRLADQFPVDVYQTGSGTSSNMNINEVISNRAIEIAGGDRLAAQKPIHPNDHVNMGQSTNDTFPTAIHVAAAVGIHERLVPALRKMHSVLAEQSERWDKILKIGRTHLMDATPLRLGQEFSGFARQLERSLDRAQSAMDAVLELPVGGTAVGTGINTHPEFGGRVAKVLAENLEVPFIEAVNHFEANATRDGLVECHSQLKTIAQTLFSVANNLRILGSGPRCGYDEIRLPSRQPGSSIMPGKVNPVLCEAMMQLTARVIGNDTAMTVSGASGGQFQLNIMMPLMADLVLQSIDLLAGGIDALTDLCVRDIEPNEAACEAGIEQSLSMCTSLNPIIGYEKAAKLAKEAFASGQTIRELCQQQGEIDAEELRDALDPWKMTEPQQ